MDDTILIVSELEKQFNLHERERLLLAFRNVSFTVQLNRLTALVGSSGSGKSSILKCIYRTYIPTAGQMLYSSASKAGIDLATASEATILSLRRTEIRFVSQFLSAMPRQSALNVVARPLIENATLPHDALEMAADMLRRVGLPTGLWDVPPHTFSGGERQLVNLSRALVVKPRLLLLDEPTASLDPKSTEQVLSVIETLKHHNMAILSVFHDLQIVERLADQTIRMTGGLDWNQRPQEFLLK